MAAAVLVSLPALAQVKEARPDDHRLNDSVRQAVGRGKIIYERTMQLQIQIADNNPAMQNMIPRERKDRYELSFANNKSLWQRMEDTQGDEMNFGGDGAQIRFVMPGSDDITYHSIDEMKKTD